MRAEPRYRSVVGRFSFHTFQLLTSQLGNKTLLVFQRLRNYLLVNQEQGAVGGVCAKCGVIALLKVLQKKQAAKPIGFVTGYPKGECVCTVFERPERRNIDTDNRTSLHPKDGRAVKVACAPYPAFCQLIVLLQVLQEQFNFLLIFALPRTLLLLPFHLRAGNGEPKSPFRHLNDGIRSPVCLTYESSRVSST